GANGEPATATTPADDAAVAPADGRPGTTMYVSWGGSGRGQALRAAVELAASAERDLTSLAILDARTTADLDPELVDAIEDELVWLLRAQTRMIRRELGFASTATEVVVRRGRIVDVLKTAINDLGADRVLIGAPALIDPGTEHVESVHRLIEIVDEGTGVRPEIVDPDDHQPAGSAGATR
ncbi:MAG: hypothetical protein S0880_06990, partial [Actinomycetota bacterium]|nr:hypothetical protein [Actinomycetota bacterium]